MADHTVTARRLHDEASAKLSGAKNPGFFRSIFSSSSAASRAEEAAELFAKAGASYKLAKRYEDAGSAYRSAAAAAEASADVAYDAPRYFAEAAKAYKAAPSATADAVSSLEDAVRLYSEAARFSQCARLKKEVAELHEAAGSAADAEAAYTAAADFFTGEDAKSSASACHVKVAGLMATRGAYKDAAALYETVAAESLASPLLKFGAREQLLMAGLCVAAGGDAIAMRRTVERFEGLDGSLAGTREGKLLEGVVSAAEAGDVEAFTAACVEYDTIGKLDASKTALLLVIKKGMKSEGEDDLL